MKSVGKRLMVVSVIVALALVAGVVSTEAKLVPRVDNFIILIDLSGSMFMNHAELQEVKAVLVKKVLRAVNEQIPHLGYTAAIQVFNPNATLIGPTEFTQGYFGQEIEKLPENGKVFGNKTPLGSEILYLDKIMGNFSGKTAVIIVSDGQANKGMEPLKAARSLRSEHTNVCFDVISFSDEPTGAATLRSISSLGNCTYAAGPDLLSDPAAVQRFVKEVLYMEVPDAVPFRVAVQEIIKEVEKDLPPEVMVLQGIYFGFDEYEPKPGFGTFIDAVYDKYSAGQAARIAVEGYTDSTGPEAYNQKLSERRARAVGDALVAKGVSANRVETVGYGENYPRVSNLTREGRAANRRVEIRVVTE